MRPWAGMWVLPQSFSVEKVFFDLVCIMFFFFQDVVYWRGVPAEQQPCLPPLARTARRRPADASTRANVTIMSGRCFPTFGNERSITHASMWCPALWSPSPISFSMALHSLQATWTPVKPKLLTYVEPWDLQRRKHSSGLDLPAWFCVCLQLDGPTKAHKVLFLHHNHQITITVPS